MEPIEDLLKRANELKKQRRPQEALLALASFLALVEWDDMPASSRAVGWPSGWFAATAGAIEDPTFERALEDAC